MSRRTCNKEALTPDEIMPVVYEQLRSLARRYMGRERAGHTLTPTALVHEAYLRLDGNERIRWRNRSHFLAIAASEMRRVLVEHARAVAAEKRGGQAVRVTLSDDIVLAHDPTFDLLALDQALLGLSEESPRQARVVELRVFAGMSFAQIAELLGVSLRTAKGDWRMGRTWLSRLLRSGGEQ